MAIKRTFSVFLNNFDLIYKMLAYFLIVIIVIVVGMSVIYIPTVKPIVDEILATNILSNIKESISQFILFNDAYLDTMDLVKANIESIKAIIKINMSKLLISYLIFVAIIGIGQFFLSLALYSTSDIINTYMTTTMKDNLTTNLTRNLYYSVRFSLVNVLFNTLYNALILVAIYYSFFGAIHLLTVFTPMFTILIAMLMWSFKKIFVTMWLPYLVCDKSSAFKGFAKSVKLGFKNFGVLLRAYFLLGLLAVVLFMVSFVFTYGLAAFIVLPGLIILFKIFELVLFYDVTKKKYYVDKKEIIEPNIEE